MSQDTSTKVRYAITYRSLKTGLRQLLHANQGRFFHDTREAAQAELQRLRQEPAAGLNALFSTAECSSFAVSPITCWSNGDACGIFTEYVCDKASLEPPVMPQPGEIYQHFKGGVYQVVNLAKHTEQDEVLVIYHRVEEPKELWARPLRMWLEPVYGQSLDPVCPRFVRIAVT